MKTTFINQLYNETIKQVLKGVPYLYQREVKINYKNNLIEKYEDLTIDKSNVNEKLNKFIQFELSYWNNLSIDMKLSHFVKDKAYEEIIFISILGLQLAQKKQDENIAFDQKMATAYVERMNELLRIVKYFNKESAKMYFFEGILDFQYASGLTEEKSIRMYENQSKTL